MNFSTKRIAQLFSERANELGWSEAEVARRAGLKQPTVHRIFKAESNNPHIDNLYSIARVLNLNIAAVLGIKASTVANSNIDHEPIDLYGKVPLISWVQAGAFSEAMDYPEPEQWLDCPFKHSDRAFCLRVTGKSMVPEYREGELLLVDPEVDPRHGRDVVVRTPDGMVTFKRYLNSEDGIHLQALNPDFEPQYLEIPENTIIVGTVIGSWIKRG
ncbi:LexA family transcriptional regulator [Pseudomonas sp. F1_0610]|uniref:LexA family protein n=1 Tax=Pseudomonas sp. F1_0610 TaxID=3114284 RepID=UPI0039C1A6A2